MPDASDFQSMFDREFAYVCQVLRRVGVRAEDLEDLAQEVFVTVYQKFRSYDREKPIRPWLLAFAVRAARNYQRLARHRRELSDENMGERLNDCASPEECVGEQQATHHVIRALESVAPERRDVLVLHDIYGYEAPEIAASLGIPVGTVYSRVHVGRQELKRALHKSAARVSQRAPR